MSGEIETVAITAASIGAAAIWVAYGSAIRGLLATENRVYFVLKICGALLVLFGLSASVGIGPTASLAAGLAIAMTAARIVITRH